MRTLITAAVALTLAAPGVALAKASPSPTLQYYFEPVFDEPVTVTAEDDRAPMMREEAIEGLPPIAEEMDRLRLRDRKRERSGPFARETFSALDIGSGLKGFGRNSR